MFKAAIIDQDDNLTRAPAPADRFYSEGFLRGLKSLVPLSHPARGRLETEDFHEWRTEVFYKEPCVHAYYATLYGLQLTDVFDQFHLGCDVVQLNHDTASALALNQLAAVGRGVLLTDASRDWAVARAAAIGHTLPIRSRSDIFDLGMFDVTKSNSEVPLQMAFEQLQANLGTSLQRGDVVVIDDSSRVLARAMQMGFAVRRCTFGGVPACDKYDAIPSVGPFVEQCVLA